MIGDSAESSNSLDGAPKKKGNGSTDWSKIAKDLVSERDDLLDQLGEVQSENARLEIRLAEMEHTGMDARAVVRLKCLQHMYSRLVNFQAECGEDKKKLDRLMKEVQHVMSKQIREVSNKR